MVSIGSSTYSKRLLHLVSWSHWFTFFNILAAIVLSSFYLFSESSPETLLGKLYLVTTWFSHMGFLTFIGFVLIIFPLTLIYPKTRLIRGTASIVFTLGLLLLLLDAFIYARLGYHLNASSSEQIIELIKTQIDRNHRAFWFISLVLFFAILSFQLLVSNYAWKHLRELQKTVYPKFIVSGLVLSFFFSHITHIWADANLEYDILRQDTMFPLSYPSTAKTLLTKYGLFDKQDYIARRTSTLSFESIPTYPSFNEDCYSKTSLQRSAILVLTDKDLTERQIDQFAQRSSVKHLKLIKHIDNALPNDSWFNLLYSLPSIYKAPVLASGKKPVLFQVLENKNIEATLTYFGEVEEHTTVKSFEPMFNQVESFDNISTYIIGKKFKEQTNGLHIFYFSGDNQYQFELFIDALLLSQREAKTKDLIWISSIGNENIDNGLNIKPALLIAPNGESKPVNALTSHFDLVPTLMNNWLACSSDVKRYSVGENITTLNKNRVIANTVDKGIMVFNKDKSVFIDQHGNFQSYSRQLESPIMVSKDFPLMIDGVHFIKQFTLNGEN